MFREAAYGCLVNISILLFILSFSISKSAAQQKIFPSKSGSLKTGMKTVYFHLTNRRDTIFQSGDNKLSDVFARNSNNKLPVKNDPQIASKPAKLTKKYSIEGAITVTINTIPTSCGYSNGSIVVSATGGTAPYTFSYTDNGYTFLQNTGNFQNLSAGSYLITVTDANGQTASTLVSLSNNFEPPVVWLSAVQAPSGCATFDGIFTLSASGGVPPYSYSLDNVNYQASNVFQNLAQGIYNIFVRDANGCIRQNNAVIFFYSANSHCLGQGMSYSYYSCNNNGTIVISIIDGGVGPYELSLDGINYQPDSNFYNLDAGFHYIYIKDATGLVNIYTITMFPWCPLNLSEVIVDASCGKTDGKLTVTPVNGTAPYTYSLDGINYQNNNTFTGLAPGNYTLTIKDSNGISVSVYEAISERCPTITATATDETCGQKNGTIISTGNNGAKPYQFSIDGINFQSSDTFTGLAAGGYTVTIKDADNFTNTVPVTINSNCLQISLGITDVVCSNNSGSINITATNGTAPYQYSIDGINFQAGNKFTTLSAGDYTVSIRDAANGQKDTLVTITDAPSPQINVGVIQASCNNVNGSIQINGTGGTAPLRYSIDDITFQNTNIFNGLDSGEYVAYIKDANGCTAIDTVQLTALPTPLVFIGNDTTLCTGEIFTLAAPQTPGYTFLWQDNTTAYNNVVTKQGTYYVKVTNQFNCPATDTINIIFRAVPNFTIGNDTSLCNGQPVLLKPFPLVGDSFLWSSGAVSSSVTVNAGGLYWLQITDSGCVKRDTINISYTPKPVINLGNDTSLCVGKTLMLAAPQTPGYSFTWQDNTTAYNNVVTKQGIYYVEVTNQFNCSASDTINVMFKSVPVFTIGNDSNLCGNQLLLLKPAPLVSGSYLWSTGAVSSSFTVSSAGLYWLQITDNGCVKRDSISISYTPKPVLNLGNDTTLCVGTTIILNATNTNSIYTWQDGSTRPTYMVNKAGLYSVRVSENGCDTLGKILVNYLSKPVVELGSDTALCITQHLLLNASNPQSTYLWQNGSTSSYFDVSQTGTYAVDVTNICGVTNASVNIDVKNCACKFYVPSAFSPNNDGKNDVFKAGYQCLFSNYEMTVFNRFGQLIFLSQDVSNGWDGSFHNVQQPIGVYVYLVTYKDNLTGKSEHIKGLVTLLR